MKHTKSLLAWQYIRFAGILTVLVTKFLMPLFRKCEYDISIDGVNKKTSPIIIVANHQTLLDSPMVFAAMPIRKIWHLSPVKFMTYDVYYNSKYKPFLYSTGCYPTHGEGLTGVEGGVYYAEHGYSSFIYPEGRRTDPKKRGKAFPGVVRMLDRVPNAQLLLCFIDWEPRTSRFSRPKVRVIWRLADETVDRTDPEAIMNKIYALGTVE